MQGTLKEKENPYRAEQKRSLLADISVAKNEMDIAQRNFDCVYKPDEVDVYIYKLREAQARYDVLLKALKDMS